MVASVETSTIMVTLKMEAMIRKPKIRRRVLPKLQMEPATQKMEARKELSLKFLPHQANKAVRRIMMMARRRRLRHPARRSDLRHPMLVN